MEGIKQGITNLCMVSLIAGVFRLMIPSGSLGKTASMMISLYVLLFLAVPFAGGVASSDLFDFHVQPMQTEEYGRLFSQEMEQAAVEEAKALVDSAAGQCGVEVTVASVKTKMQDNKVWIEELVLQTDCGEIQIQQLTQIIKQSIDTTVTVVSEEP